MSWTEACAFRNEVEQEGQIHVQDRENPCRLTWSDDRSSNEDDELFELSSIFNDEQRGYRSVETPQGDLTPVDSEWMFIENLSPHELRRAYSKHSGNQHFARSTEPQPSEKTDSAQVQPLEASFNFAGESQFRESPVRTLQAPNNTSECLLDTNAFSSPSPIKHSLSDFHNCSGRLSRSIFSGSIIECSPSTLPIGKDHSVICIDESADESSLEPPSNDKLANHLVLPQSMDLIDLCSP